MDLLVFPVPAPEIFWTTTRNGIQVFGMDSGLLRVGKLTDLILVDTKNTFFIPNQNTILNLVYTASGTVADTIICNGRILTVGGVAEGQEEMIQKGKNVGRDLVSRFRVDD